MEIAFSRQLGGTFVLWRSGVSALKAPRSVTYGWVEAEAIGAAAAAIMEKAETRGPALLGYSFDYTGIDFNNDHHSRPTR